MEGSPKMSFKEAVKQLKKETDEAILDWLNSKKDENEEHIDIPVLDTSPENCKPVDICGNCMHLDFSGYCTCEHVTDKFKSPMEDASSCKFYSPYPKEGKHGNY